MSVQELMEESPLAIQLAVSAWQKEKTSSKVMDEVLCEEFANIIYDQIKLSNLGNAKTRELIEELQARLGKLEDKFPNILVGDLLKQLGEEELNYKTTNYK